METKGIFIFIIALSAQVTVVDRPTTQQGLAMKTAKPGGRRQVQDKTYFLGQIRYLCCTHFIAYTSLYGYTNNDNNNILFLYPANQIKVNISLCGKLIA